MIPACLRTIVATLVAAVALATTATAAPDNSAAQFRATLPGVSGTPVEIPVDELLPSLPSATREAYTKGEIDIAARLWKSDAGMVLEYIQSSDYERHSNEVAKDAAATLGSPALERDPVRLWRNVTDEGVTMDTVLVTRNGVSVEVMTVPPAMFTQNQLLAIGETVAAGLPQKASSSSVSVKPIGGLFGLALVGAIITGIIKSIRRRRGAEAI